MLERHLLIIASCVVLAGVACGVPATEPRTARLHSGDDLWERVDVTLGVPKGWFSLDPEGGDVATFDDDTHGTGSDLLRVTLLDSRDKDVPAFDGGAMYVGGKAKSVVVRPGVRMVDTGGDDEARIEFRDSVVVEHFIAGAPPRMLRCQVFGRAEVLVESCKALTFAPPVPVLEAAVSAAEEAKLADCPAVSRIELGGSSPPVLAATEAKAFATGRGSSSRSLEITIQQPEDPKTAPPGLAASLVFELVAQPGGEVVSGSYARSEPESPGLTDVVFEVDSERFDLGAPVTAKATIVARTARRVCGTLSLEGRWVRVFAKFDATF